MKCPNCGEEIDEGYLYCEKCGEDIHIVPDYDLGLEDSLKNSLAEIMSEVENEKRREQLLLLEKEHKKKKIRCVVISIICVFVLCGFFYGLIRFVGQLQYHSYDFQITKGYELVDVNRVADSLVYFERALELNQRDAKLRLQLADIYRYLEMEEEYIEQLTEVTKATYSSELDIETAYEKLIDHYKAKKDYLTINLLLVNCSNQDIINANQEFVTHEPNFSYEEGVYSEIIPLKLTSNSAGTIYYTTDGSVPNENSLIYTAPIFLETGEHIISAYFVNSYGIMSNVVTAKYTIEVQRPAEPEVNVYSGDYSYPVSISVDVLEGTKVYYTTDGTMPTNQSTEYHIPIPMPLGKSIFKFITYNDEGVSGEVAVREYHLKIDSDVTVDDACQVVIDKMLEIGKIYNCLGESYNVAGKYQYNFKYALAVDGQGDYYVIVEVYEDDLGNRIITGTEYAVNIYDKSLYKFTADENGNYLLEGF